MLSFFYVPKEVLEMCMCINKNMNIRESSENWVNEASKWDRGLHVTINLWEWLMGKDWKTMFRIYLINKNLTKNIEKRVFTNSNKRIEIFPIVHRNTEKNHIHILTNTPQHMKRKHYAKAIERAVNDTYQMTLSPDKDAIKPIYEIGGAANYIHKELVDNDNYESIDAEGIQFIK